MFFQELKTYVRRPLLIIAYIVFSLFLLFYPTQGDNKKLVFQSLVPQHQVIRKAVPVLPVRLIIPQINVNADINYVGVTPEGAMEVPSNAVDVGWFKLGPRPGEKGSAVIAGHFNGKNGEAGVFNNLYILKGGDQIFIENNKGATITFIVRESRIYNQGYANDVFSASDSAHLNLITCDGVWDGVKKSYSKRLVIFTDISQ
ncbi:MAG: class F sortase [bacterium]|nr:class F sortase [bacterium]